MPPSLQPDRMTPPDPLPAPPSPALLGTARAARLLETALTTPDGQPEDWQGLLWKPPLIGSLREWVPEYEVEQRVARGSSGWVYLARHRLLDRQVALKVLAPAGMGDEDKTAALRTTEGRLIARLSHPNVLRVYDSRPLPDGQHLFVFQYADGGSLRQRLAGGPLRRGAALVLASGVAAGLAHAHEGGIIHRDLKPENILFNETGTPMIGDFGSAVEPRPEDAGVSRCGTTGTPNYRAPEQARGGPVTPAVDLYALGVMLHEMLTGSIPHGAGGPEPVSLSPRLSPGVRGLLTSLLHPDPLQRGTASKLAPRLRRLEARPRHWWIAGGVAAAYLAVAAVLWWGREKPVAALPPPAPAQPIVLSEREARRAVVAVLQEWRESEARGDWAAGNKYYGDFVDYFGYGALPHSAVVARRMSFAEDHRYFRTLLLETPSYRPAPPPQVAFSGLYWAVTESKQGGYKLGALKDEMVFQPRVQGDPVWRIISHQHGEPTALWSCDPGRTLDEAGARELVDRFLKIEEGGNVDEQLKWYAPVSRYYTYGWCAHRHIRESVLKRQADRPGFRCERRGPVTVQKGSHLRWRVEFPCVSLPPPTGVAGGDQVRVRTFLFAPLEAREWRIIAEATPTVGLSMLNSFWQDGLVP